MKSLFSATARELHLSIHHQKLIRAAEQRQDKLRIMSCMRQTELGLVQNQNFEIPFWLSVD